MDAPRERKHRLPEAAYLGRKSISFTACELHRKPLLADSSVMEPLVSILTDAIQTHRSIVPIYCFMPDHLHVVIMGTADNARPKTAMEMFKHRSGIWLERNRQEIEWQANFHDRIIRKSDDWASHVRYIACNPIRAGLAEDIHQWPFTGSIGCDLRDILGDAFWS